VLLLKGDGRTVFQHTAANVDQDDVASVVVGLRRAAKQLSDTLGQTQCPAIHVKGSRNAFSCHEVEKDLILAVFRRMEETQVESLDSKDVDASVAPILEELRVLMHSAVV